MDQPIFRAGEVLEMAVEVEGQGISFYEACRDHSSDPKAAEVFDYLIDQEKKHAEIFRGMESGLAEDYEVPESYPGEMRRYMDSFVKDRVFEPPERASEHKEDLGDPFDVIPMAIRFEEKSIVFYSKLKDAVRSSEGEVMDRIIRQEHSHIARLLRLRDELEREAEGK
jgi:rubrerythrin